MPAPKRPARAAAAARRAKPPAAKSVAKPKPRVSVARAVAQTPSPPLVHPARARHILSAGAKGGPGKTFLCKNLAGAAARAGWRVAVVDFDTQRTLTKWIQRREQFSPDKVPITSFAADPQSTEDARDVLALSAEGKFDVIFFDTPPAIDHHPDVLKTLAFAADLILVPSAVGIADTESAEVLLATLQEWRRPALAILNKVKRNAIKTISIAKKRLLRSADVCTIEIGEYYDYLVADEIGLGATEMDACVGQDDIDALWTIVARAAKLTEA